MPLPSLFGLLYEDLTKAAKTAVQSVLIPQSRYSLAEAKKWLREHGYHTGKPPDASGKYYRFRQRDPGEFSRMRTKSIAGGIKLIIGWK